MSAKLQSWLVPTCVDPGPGKRDRSRGAILALIAVDSAAFAAAIALAVGMPDALDAAVNTANLPWPGSFTNAPAPGPRKTVDAPRCVVMRIGQVHPVPA